MRKVLDKTFMDNTYAYWITKTIATVGVIFLNGVNAESLTQFVDDGKMDVLLALVMAFIWALRMVSYVLANERGQVVRGVIWKRVEFISECAVLVVGAAAIIIALAVNGLHPASITNVIAVSVAIFISYTTLPKVFRNNKNTLDAITKICAYPRYKMAQTMYIESLNDEEKVRFRKTDTTLAIEYMRGTVVNTQTYAGPWQYKYRWNGKVHIRDSDVTLLITDAELDYRLFHMSGNKAHKILNDSDASEQMLVAANLLAGMVPKSSFNELYVNTVLTKCYDDENTRYAVTSAKGVGYGINPKSIMLNDKQEWIRQMKEYVIEVIAVYLGEGNDCVVKVENMINVMIEIQNNIYLCCHEGFDANNNELMLRLARTL